MFIVFFFLYNLFLFIVFFIDFIVLLLFLIKDLLLFLDHMTAQKTRAYVKKLHNIGGEAMYGPRTALQNKQKPIHKE